MENIKNNVIDILKQCNDPELPIDLWNLGLIYDLKVSCYLLNSTVNFQQNNNW